MTAVSGLEHFPDGLGRTETSQGQLWSHRESRPDAAAPARSHWRISGRCSRLLSQVPIHGEMASVCPKELITLTVREDSRHWLVS